MFRKGIRLPFDLAGIPLYLDLSFLLVLPLMVWVTTQNLAAIAGNVGLDPGVFGPGTTVALGLIAVFGLFASVVLHELGHSLTARRYGVKVRRITLWFLGGVAEFEEMPRQRGAEAVVAIAGPIVSFVLAGLFIASAAIVPRTLPAVWIICAYLGLVNLMLGIFNLLPAMPMDGGRILRSLLALKLSHARATQIAGNVAKGVAVLMGVWGILGMNFWLIILAVFVFTAARRETEYAVVTENLRGVGVADVMNRDVQSVPAGMTVGQLAPHVFATRHSGFPVVDDMGRMIGTVGLEQMRLAYPETPVWQVMSTEVPTIHEGASALDAYARMAAANVGRLMVVDDAGRMCGILTLADLTRVIHVRMAGFQVVEPQAGPYYGPRPPYAQPPLGPQPPYASPGGNGYTPAHAPGDPQRYARQA